MARTRPHRVETASTEHRKPTGARKRASTSASLRNLTSYDPYVTSEGTKPSLYQLAYGNCLADEDGEAFNTETGA